MFEAIRRWADDDLRSINAQIEYLLTEQARRAGRLPHHRARPVEPDAPEPEDHDPVLGSEQDIGTSAGRR